jgi:hypothetical protein
VKEARVALVPGAEKAKPTAAAPPTADPSGW